MEAAQDTEEDISDSDVNSYIKLGCNALLPERGEASSSASPFNKPDYDLDTWARDAVASWMSEVELARLVAARRCP